MYINKNFTRGNEKIQNFYTIFTNVILIYVYISLCDISH